MAITKRELGYHTLTKARQWRRAALLVSGCVVAAVFLAAASVQRTALYRAYETRRAQGDCLSYIGPADKPPSGVPACWQFFCPAQRRDPPLAFMHERVSPSAKRRLVIVQLDLQASWGDGYGAVWGGVGALCCRWEIGFIQVKVFEIRSPWRAAAGLRGLSESLAGQVGVAVGPVGHPYSNLHLGAAGTARLFNGQPDPADPSHFTIGYSLDNRRGTVDGWLRDNDDVDLKVRD